MSEKIDKLERLAALRDRGILTEAEFQTEKASVFAPPRLPETVEGSGAEGVTPTSRPEKSDKATGDVRALWETFRPISSLAEARQLLNAGWYTALIIIGDGLIDIAVDFFDASNGRQLELGMSNGDAIGMHLGTVEIHRE